MRLSPLDLKKGKGKAHVLRETVINYERGRPHVDLIQAYFTKGKVIFIVSDSKETWVAFSYRCNIITGHY